MILFHLKTVRRTVYKKQYNYSRSYKLKGKDISASLPINVYKDMALKRQQLQVIKSWLWSNKYC